MSAEKKNHNLHSSIRNDMIHTKRKAWQWFFTWQIRKKRRKAQVFVNDKKSCFCNLCTSDLITIFALKFETLMDKLDTYGTKGHTVYFWIIENRKKSQHNCFCFVFKWANLVLCTFSLHHCVRALVNRFHISYAIVKLARVKLSSYISFSL